MGIRQIRKVKTSKTDKTFFFITVPPFGLVKITINQLSTMIINQEIILCKVNLFLIIRKICIESVFSHRLRSRRVYVIIKLYKKGMITGGARRFPEEGTIFFIRADEKKKERGRNERREDN